LRQGQRPDTGGGFKQRPAIHDDFPLFCRPKCKISKAKSNGARQDGRPRHDTAVASKWHAMARFVACV
jgi:hypothetical protein